MSEEPEKRTVRWGPLSPYGWIGFILGYIVAQLIGAAALLTGLLIGGGGYLGELVAKQTDE